MFRLVCFFVQILYIFQVPDNHYLLLPTWHSQLKMTIIGFLPQIFAQKWAAQKYRKALPKVVPQSPPVRSFLPCTG